MSLPSSVPCAPPPFSTQLPDVTAHERADALRTELARLRVADQPTALDEGHRDGAPWRGSGTWLVVDDDPSIVRLVTLMLRRLGISAITASNGVEALRLLPEHPEIDGVLLDLTMPGLDGEAVFREVQRIRPAMPVILSSGYSNAPVAAELMQHGLSGFLPKPFGLSDLRRLVRAVAETTTA